LRVLITGGAGFIGSHLAELFVHQGHRVTVLDDLSSGSRENIAHLIRPGEQNAGRAAVVFHHDTIFNPGLLDRLMAESDLVYHLAAAVGVKRIIQAPVGTIETNVAGCELVLRLAARHRRRFVLASTSEVYGKSAQLPFSEDGDLVMGPTDRSRWSYACSKAIDEFLALAWHRQNGLPVTIARLFNTVGPRQSGRYGMVLPTFVGQALRGEPITVYGSGEQTRCFTHVADIVEGLAALAGHDRTIGEIYNLGSTAEISIHRLARSVIAATGSRTPVVHIPYEQAYAPGFEDIPRRVPDIAKARTHFGFHPRRSLEQILTDVILDLRSRLQPKIEPRVERGRAAKAANS
jgi:nucleoside-diphosphate-sugar epimerase